jgi:Zn-dependent protease with chaperone function
MTVTPETNTPDIPVPAVAGDPLRAVYFDGTSSRKHSVVLHFGTAIDIVENGNAIAIWAPGDVRRADGPPRTLRLSSVGGPPLARLEISDDDTRAMIIAHCHSLDAAQVTRSQTLRIVVWSLAACASLIAIVLYGIPAIADQVAPLVPYAVEKRIGSAVDGQVRTIFGGQTCTTPDGQAAFATLVDKVKRAGNFDLPIEAVVLSSHVPNAVALPGGLIYLLDGLLLRARSPDEIAGILAHEIAHVQHRDGLRALIRAGGTSFLLGLLLGDVFGAGALIFATQAMLDATYSRDAEQDADAFAIAVLRRLGRSPRPMGELLVRITGTESGKNNILASHPLSRERLDRMRAADIPETGPPILSDHEWQALKSICRGR